MTRRPHRRHVRAAATTSAAIVTVSVLLAACASIPQHPGPLETDFVPTASPSSSIDRGSLSPDGFTAAQRMTVRVRNIGCNGLSTGTGFAVDATTLAVVTTDQPLGVWSTRASVDPVEGDKITVVGYPLGGQLTTVDGLVLGETTDPLGASGGPVFATTAPVQPGSSGSPALNSAGEVVGVIYAKNDVEQSFMVPVSTLRKLLDEDGLLEPQPNVCPTPTAGAGSLSGT
jgi:hypothetical protein